MAIEIIFVDKNRDLLDHWNVKLNDLSGMFFENISFSEIVNNINIDAIILRWIFALERYGGKPINCKSQIINTQSDKTVPDFVITTPTFFADSSPPEGEWDRAEWMAIFKAYR
jgi:hypothetical protein